MDDEVAKAERMVKNATKDSDTENDEVLEKFYKRHNKEKWVNKKGRLVAHDLVHNLR